MFMPNTAPTPDPSAPATPAGMGALPPQTQDPGISQQIPQQQPQNAPTPSVPIPAAAAPHLAKMAALGQVFHRISTGSSTQYVQTPQGPVPTQVPDKPGQLFRNILGGLLAGAGAGAEAKMGGGIGSFAVGAQAGQQQQLAQQQRAQQQAQQQFENTQKANSAASEETLRKAQLAQANAETLRTNILTQGASWDLHQRVAEADKARVATYENSGVKPVYEGITESQMQDYIKNNPGASTLDWRHTGVVPIVDASGNPSYEYTLSAYDPTAKVSLAPATIKQWDDDGLFKYHPEYKDMITSGRGLTVGQFTALDSQAQNYANQDLAKNKNKLENDHLQAQIDEAKAAIKEHQATTAHENLSTQELAEEKKRKDEEQTAWDHLAAAGNDIDKLTNPQDRVSLARAAQPLVAEALAGIKQASAEAQSGDASATAELPDLWAKYNALSKLSSLTPKAEVEPITFIDNNGKQVLADTQALIDKATKLGYKKVGQTPPASAPAGPDLTIPLPSLSDAASRLSQGAGPVPTP